MKRTPISKHESEDIARIEEKIYLYVLKVRTIFIVRLCTVPLGSNDCAPLSIIICVFIKEEKTLVVVEVKSRTYYVALSAFSGADCPGHWATNESQLRQC